MIDTHKIFKRLSEAGVSQAECEALIETVREIDDSPTRGDLKELETSFIKWMVASLGLVTAIMLGAMYFLNADLKGDIRELRSRPPHASESNPAVTP
jgi:hypothetical protein